MAHRNVTNELEGSVNSIVNVSRKAMMRSSFIKLIPFECRSKTLRNTLDIMAKKGMIISDKVASKCVIELSNAFDDVVKDVGADQFNRSSVLLFEAMLCKTVTYMCRLEANIKDHEESKASNETPTVAPDIAALLVENKQMRDVVSTADRQIVHLRSARDKILKSKQEELEQVHKEMNTMRKHLLQVQEEAKKDKSQYMEKEKALQLVLTQLSSAQEEIKKLKRITINTKKAPQGINANTSTFSINDSKVIKAFESKRDEELRSLRIGKDILRHELHKERVSRSADIADLINTQNQIEEYANELELVNQILNDENQLRLETEQRVIEYADKLDEVHHQLTMSTKVMDTPINSPVRSHSPTRLPKSPMRHHSPQRPKSTSPARINENSNLVESLRESLKAVEEEKAEIQRQCVEDTAHIQSVIENMQHRLQVLTEENHRLQQLLHSSPHQKEKTMDSTIIHDNGHHTQVGHHAQVGHIQVGRAENISAEVDELKKKLLTTTETLIATRNENLNLKSDGVSEANHDSHSTFLIQIEALKKQTHHLTEQLVNLQHDNQELRYKCDNHESDSKLRKELVDAEKKIILLNEQLARLPPSLHVAMAEKRVLEAKLAKAIDTGDTKVRLLEKQKEKAIHELHSVLSTELSEKEALRNTAQEQALTIHQLTLHLKLLQDASIENEREHSKYDIEKSILLSDFESEYNNNNLDTSQVSNGSHRWGIESRRTVSINEMNSSKLDDSAVNSSVHSIQFPVIDGLNQLRLNEEKFRELDRLLNSAKRISQ